MIVYLAFYDRDKWKIMEMNTKDIRYISERSAIYKGVISFNAQSLFKSKDGANAYISKKYGAATRDRYKVEDLWKRQI